MLAVAVTWKQERSQIEGCAALQKKFDLILETTEFTASDVETLLNTVSESDWFEDQELTDERVTQILGYALFPIEETT